MKKVVNISVHMIRNPKQAILGMYSHFLHDSLYRNSIYLMLTTFTGAFFGFFFWMINARLFSSEQIGLATALISSMTLIANFSLLGLNLGIIRYLPKSDRKTDKINTVVAVTFLSTLIVTLIYLIGLPSFSPRLLFLKDNIFFVILFFIVTIFFTLDTIYSNVFIAYRNSKYVFYKSLVGNILKIIAPFALVAFGSFAIFISASFSAVITAIISLIILYRIFGYRLRATIKKDLLRKMSKLSFGNYVASFMNNLPVTLLPIMITNNLGPSQAAFFYLDIMIVNLLNIIQYSLNQSLFAEGSNNISELRKNVIKSLKFIYGLLLPAIAGVFLLGGYVLSLFGKEYSVEGIAFLRLMSLTTIFVAINGTLSAILNVKGKVGSILFMSTVGALILLTFSYFALPYGLITLGYAWIISEGVISFIYLVFVFFREKKYEKQ